MVLQQLNQLMDNHGMLMTTVAVGVVIVASIGSFVLIFKSAKKKSTQQDIVQQVKEVPIMAIKPTIKTIMPKAKASMVDISSLSVDELKQLLAEKESQEQFEVKKLKLMAMDKEALIQIIIDSGIELEL